MKPSALLTEGSRSAWAQKISSGLVLIVVAVICFTALSTVGRAVANDRELAATMETEGSRLLTVTDSGMNDLINTALLGVVQGISGVESAVALSLPTDVHVGAVPGGEPVPLWRISDVTRVATLDRGRTPLPGEATVTAEVQSKLGLVEPAGYVESREAVQFPVVSRSVVRPGFSDLANGALVQADEQTQYNQLRVVIASVEEVETVQKAVLTSLGAFDPSTVSIESPRALNTLAALLNSQLARYNQALLAMILGVGAIFIAIVTLSDVLLHRKELGRRRALGATRLDLSLLTVLRVVVPAGVGALVGSVSAIAFYALDNINLPLSFVAAVAWLAVITAGLAATVPAVWASMRDPVSVLRTP
ncbi:ABC transporter permease [Actinomyces minihominis]|uniref:ABC transporter permease n=1 Tax=Actinomyces minihominis TaxID=2002838 RepID=UPI000C07C325|nr:FtsX-like permease family protein [Actinomyces minihominis]